MSTQLVPNLYEHIYKLYNNNLKVLRVKLPGPKTKLGCALCCLYDNIGSPIHIDNIKHYVINHGHTLTGTDPLQVRHLSTQCGFNIIKDGKYKHILLDLENRSPKFRPERRNISLSNDIWSQMLTDYNHMCVNCGSRNGEPLRWNPNQTTSLQQGHMDPRQPLTENNTIPQCQWCNQQYLNKAIFNCRGAVIDFNRNGFT